MADVLEAQRTSLDKLESSINSIFLQIGSALNKATSLYEHRADRDLAQQRDAGSQGTTDSIPDDSRDRKERQRENGKSEDRYADMLAHSSELIRRSVPQHLDNFNFALDDLECHLASARIALQRKVAAQVGDTQKYSHISPSGDENKTGHPQTNGNEFSSPSNQGVVAGDTSNGQLNTHTQANGPDTLAKTDQILEHPVSTLPAHRDLTADAASNIVSEIRRASQTSRSQEQEQTTQVVQRQPSNKPPENKDELRSTSQSTENHTYQPSRDSGQSKKYEEANVTSKTESSDRSNHEKASTAARHSSQEAPVGNNNSSEENSFSSLLPGLEVYANDSGSQQDVTSTDNPTEDNLFGFEKVDDGQGDIFDSNFNVDFNLSREGFDDSAAGENNFGADDLFGGDTGSFGGHTSNEIDHEQEQQQQQPGHGEQGGSGMDLFDEQFFNLDG